MRATLAVLLCIVAGCGGSSKPLTTVDLVAMVEPSVIVLDVSGPRMSAMGSGFVVSDDGLAITNVHVLEGATEAVARFADGKTAIVTGVKVFDEDRDLAVIQLSDVNGRKPLRLSEKLPLKGSSTLAFGAPKGLEFTATEGIVSAIRPLKEIQEGWPKASHIIQTSAPISAGNSGGPLMNEAGEVIGINTFVYTSGQNLNFAVSALDAKDLLTSVTDRLFPLPMRSTNQPAEQTALSQGEKNAASMLESLGVNRRKELDSIQKEIDAAKVRVRESMIKIDVQAEVQARRELASKISAFNQAKTRPFELPVIETFRFVSGKIGRVHPSYVRVAQVLDKEDGICLVHGYGRVFQLVGMDLTNVADSDDLNLADLVFEVLGTTTYETVGNSTKTVFVLRSLFSVSNLNDIMKTVASPDGEVEPLTGSEKEERAHNLKLADIRQAEAGAKAEARRVEIEVKRLEDAKRRKEQDEVRAAEKERANRIAASEAAAERLRESEKKAEVKLEFARKFLDKKDKVAAKKWLALVIKDYPGTKSAESAAEMLKKLD